MDRQQLERKWRTSRYTGTSGNCLEAASADGVMVRDTKDRDGVTLRFTVRTWQKFTESVK